MGAREGSVSNFKVVRPARSDASAAPDLSGSAGTPTHAREEVVHVASGLAVESVIGDDDRLTQLYTKDIPERLVCALTIRAAGQVFHGTGWLAALDLVLTCGHNVHHPRFGGWATEIEVVPGRSEDDRPFGTTTSTRFSAHQAWVNEQAEQFDIGCLHLDTPLGDLLGWFAVRSSLAPQDLLGKRVQCSGYPVFQGGFSRQRKGTGEVVEVSGSRLFHDADTNDGQSGAPIWLLGDGQRPPSVIGVHCYEKVALSSPSQREANSGVLLDATIVALISNWMVATTRSDLETNT